MSVYRRGETYWYKFWFANKLIRESAKTSSKTLAREAEKKRRRELEEGIITGSPARTDPREYRRYHEAADELIADYALRNFCEFSSIPESSALSILRPTWAT